MKSCVERRCANTFKRECTSKVFIIQSTRAHTNHVTPPLSAFSLASPHVCLPCFTQNNRPWITLFLANTFSLSYLFFFFFQLLIANINSSILTCYLWFVAASNKGIYDYRFWLVYTVKSTPVEIFNGVAQFYIGKFFDCVRLLFQYDFSLFL